jgi:hypothetical protein
VSDRKKKKELLPSLPLKPIILPSKCHFKFDATSASGRGSGFLLFLAFTSTILCSLHVSTYHSRIHYWALACYHDLVSTCARFKSTTILCLQSPRKFYLPSSPNSHTENISHEGYERLRDDKFRFPCVTMMMAGHPENPCEPGPVLSSLRVQHSTLIRTLSVDVRNKDDFLSQESGCNQILLSKVRYSTT